MYNIFIYSIINLKSLVKKMIKLPLVVKKLHKQNCFLYILCNKVFEIN